MTQGPCFCLGREMHARMGGGEDGWRDGFNSGSGIGSGFLRAHTHGQVKEIKVQRDRTMQDAASLERHNADLTAQCQALLRTVEEYREQLASPAVQRAVMISTPGQAAAAGAAAGAQDAIGKGTDAQSYITNQLVTFRNVEELQTQNEKLLKVVRQLSQDMDREAEVRKEELRAEYATRIEDALREVQEIRRERDVLEADKRSLAQQRDMYRILLAEADRSFVQPDDDSAAPPAEARASGAGGAGVAGGAGGVGGGGSSEVVSPPASRTRQTADAVRKVQSEMKELRERSEAQTSVLRAEVCMLACMVIRCRVGGCGGHGECGRQCCVLVCLCANVPMCVCVCVLCMCVHIHACVNLRAHVHTCTRSCRRCERRRPRARWRVRRRRATARSSKNAWSRCARPTTPSRRKSGTCALASVACRRSWASRRGS